MHQTASKLREFVIENFYIPPDMSLHATTSFLETGIIDSTGVLELVTFIEAQFGISVRDEDLVAANFDSLAALTAFVERMRA
jgi:acyl carrier protein